VKRSKHAEHLAERAIGNVLSLVLLVAVVVQLVRGEDASSCVLTSGLCSSRTSGDDAGQWRG
jgi:hypothetical protein